MPKIPTQIRLNPDKHWRWDANCRGTYPDDGAFGSQGAQGEKVRRRWARKWCGTCPVRQECLDYAYRANMETRGGVRSHPVQWGVYGGKDFTRKAYSRGGQETVKAWERRIGQKKWEKEHGLG